MSERESGREIREFDREGVEEERIEQKNRTYENAAYSLCDFFAFFGRKKL